MAEKEERIFVFKTDDGCELREQVPDCNGCTFWPCDENCIGRKEPITRQEAIECIAKAICKRGMFGCERCVFGKDKEKCEEWIAFNHIRDAEAALNALLEAK